MDAGYRTHLVNTSAVVQYSGLKYADDAHDARWLARLMKLGILPEGYIYPKQDRGLRDLLRRRCFLVRQRTSLLLSSKTVYTHAKNGNPYLSWAFSEAAHFAVRFEPLAKKWYDRKMAQANKVVANRALAHKLARACYYVLRDRVPFDPARAFGS